MATYIRLIRMTDEGRKALDKGEGMLARFQKIIGDNGATLVNTWATLGRYDFVAVLEAPDHETMMKVSALLAATGWLSAETLPAIPTQDMVGMLG